MNKNYVWWIDIPTDVYDGADATWKNTGTFFSREEAIAFAMAEYGADEDGCVRLITQGEAVEDDEEEEL